MQEQKQQPQVSMNSLPLDTTQGVLRQVDTVLLLDMILSEVLRVDKT